MSPPPPCKALQLCESHSSSNLHSVFRPTAELYPQTVWLTDTESLPNPAICFIYLCGWNATLPSPSWRMHSTLLGNGDSHCWRIVPPGGTLSQTATIPFLDDNEEVKCCWVSCGSSWYLEAASNVATRVGLIQSKYFENLINLSFRCTTVPPSPRYKWKILMQPDWSVL